jgi:hypothetical protein
MVFRKQGLLRQCCLVKNVVSVSQIRNEFIESTETLTADQLKVKSLQDQQKRFSELAKREKARQSLVKAQKNLLKVNSNEFK